MYCKYNIIGDLAAQFFSECAFRAWPVKLENTSTAGEAYTLSHLMNEIYVAVNAVEAESMRRFAMRALFEWAGSNFN